MRLHISYSEANELIGSCTDQPITIGSSWGERLAVTYRYKTKVFLLGEVSKDVTIKFRVDSVSAHSLTLTVANGILGGVLAKALKSLSENSAMRFMTVYDSQVYIDLEQIPALASVIRYVNLTSVAPNQDDLQISFDINTYYLQ